MSAGIISTSIGDKVIDSQETIDFGKSRVYSFAPVDRDNAPTVTVQFKDVSPKGLDVIVLDEDEYINMNAGQQFRSYECLSRRNVVNYKCSKRVETHGKKLFFVVQNETAGVGGTDAPASYELKVDAWQRK